MKIYKIWCYSTSKEFYFKNKSGRDRKLEQLKKNNPYDYYELTLIKVSEAK